MRGTTVRRATVRRAAVRRHGHAHERNGERGNRMGNGRADTVDTVAPERNGGRGKRSENWEVQSYAHLRQNFETERGESCGV